MAPTRPNFPCFQTVRPFLVTGVPNKLVNQQDTGKVSTLNRENENLSFGAFSLFFCKFLSFDRGQHTGSMLRATNLVPRVFSEFKMAARREDPGKQQVTCIQK